MKDPALLGVVRRSLEQSHKVAVDVVDRQRSNGMVHNGKREQVLTQHAEELVRALEREGYEVRAR